MAEDLVNRLRNLAGMIPHKHTLPSGADTVICSLEAFMQIKELAGEAADAIEELSKPRWIPVTERLPKNYTDVLIYYERNAWPDGADYPVRKREIGIGFCGGPDRWHVDHCSGVDGLAWMPMPEPPREEV